MQTAAVFHIIIPVHNRLALTRRCLEALCRQTDKGFDVLVVDDGSIDGTAEAIVTDYASRLPVSVLAGDGHLWWGGAIKLGCEHVLSTASLGEYVVTLNNDVTVGPGFIACARSLAHDFPHAMLGAVSLDSENVSQVAQTARRMRIWPLAITERVWWPATVQELDQQTRVTDVDFLPGTATFLPIEIVRRIGPVRAELLPHYHGDSELSYRVKKSGADVLLCRDLRVFHELRETGLASDTRNRLSLGQALLSLFSRGSINGLLYKWRFARACCPVWAIPSFLVCDTLKALVRTLGSILVGDRIEALRAALNPRPRHRG